MTVQGRGSRWQLLAAAVVFAVALYAGFQLANSPDFKSSDAVWNAFWNVRSHRVDAIVSGYLVAVAGAALAWFATLLGRRVGSETVLASGWAAAVLFWIGAIGWMSVPTLRSIDGAPGAGADVFRAVTEIGSEALGVIGAPLVGFLFVAACVAGRRRGVLGPWVARAGYVIAVVGGVGGVAMLGLLVLPLWPLLVGVSVALAHERSESVAAAAA